jgi:hypothetical protein
MSPTIKKVSTPSASEIDDIFSRKAETVTPKTNHPTSSSGLKQKKRKRGGTQTQFAEPKCQAPEIVLDPSTQSTSKTTSLSRTVPPRKKQKAIETKVDQDKFRDSRGTGPRKCIPTTSLLQIQSTILHLQAAKPTRGTKYIKKTSLVSMQRPEVSRISHLTN